MLLAMMKMILTAITVIAKFATIHVTLIVALASVKVVAIAFVNCHGRCHCESSVKYFSQKRSSYLRHVDVCDFLGATESQS